MMPDPAKKITVKFRRWRKMPDMTEERSWVSDPEHDGIATLEYGERKEMIPPGIDVCRVSPGVYQEPPFGNIHRAILSALMQSGIVKDFRLPTADVMNSFNAIPLKGGMDIRFGADGFVDIKFMPPERATKDSDFLDDMQIGYTVQPE